MESGWRVGWRVSGRVACEPLMYVPDSTYHKIKLICTVELVCTHHHRH